MPNTRPGFFAVDMDVDPNNSTLHDYFRGISDILGARRRGAYAGTGVLRKLKSLGLIDFTWRCMSGGFNGGLGNVDINAGTSEFDIVQTGWINNKFDKNIAFSPDFGQWRLNWTPSIPSPEPIVHLWIIQMCAHEDPKKPAGQTTNSAQVEIIQNALMKERWNDGEMCLHSTGFVPGRWDTPTKGAYRRWQQRCGYKDGTPAVDGIPGMNTLSKLGAAHNFHVVS